MCGRFTLSDPDGVRRRFELLESVEIDERPRFNIAPTDPVLAVRNSGEELEVGRLRWGLQPGRRATEEPGRPLINARAETVATTPAFRDSFRARRCLIPADGFYEWRSDERGKQPVWISRRDGELFAFAGIWATVAPAAGEAVSSCAILTCEPNSLVAPIHDRMPVILDPAAESAWLDPEATPQDLQELLGPLPEDQLTVREVAPHVNDARADGPHLLEPPLRLF